MERRKSERLALSPAGVTLDMYIEAYFNDFLSWIYWVNSDYRCFIATSARLRIEWRFSASVVVIVAGAGPRRGSWRSRAFTTMYDFLFSFTTIWSNMSANQATMSILFEPIVILGRRCHRSRSRGHHQTFDVQRPSSSRAAVSLTLQLLFLSEIIPASSLIRTPAT